MSATLKLGIVRNAWQKLFGVYAQSTLKEQHIESTLVYYPDETTLYKALAFGEIQVIPQPLKDVPSVLPNGIVISALTKCAETRTCLILPRNTEGGDFSISDKKNIKIGTSNALHAAQIESILPDTQAVVASATPIEWLEKLRNKEIDACLLTALAVHVMSLQDSDWQIVSFSPRELVTEVGQAIACFIAAEDDLPTRRLLKTVHQPTITAIANVERRLKKLFGEQEVAAYCERDRANNFHLSAATLINGSLQRVRLSQTMAFEIEKRAFEQLTF